MISSYLKAVGNMGRAILAGRAQYMILYVNSVCNARCRMCFNWDEMASRRNPKGLSVEQLAKLAKSVKPLPQLTLSGGEPLLRNDLDEIIADFYDKASTRFFTVPTNALLPENVGALAESFIHRSPHAFLNFCLPFHGVDDRFDDILGVPGAFEKFKQTVEVIRAKRKKASNISCTLNFVMSKFNFSHWRSIIDAAQAQYPDAALGIAYARGRTHEPDAVEVPVAQYQAAQDYLASFTKKKGRNPYVLVHTAIGRQICAVVAGVAGGQIKNLGCGAGRRILVVYDDGSVYPCEMLELMFKTHKPEDQRLLDTVRLGTLADHDFDINRLLATDHARNVVQWIRSHDCACTWECAIYNKIVNSPKEIARLGIRVANRI